jgi:hypothetical protein
MSNTSTNTLQVALEKRAGERLDRELEKLSEFIRGNSLFHADSIPQVKYLKKAGVEPGPDSTEKPTPDVWEFANIASLFRYERRGTGNMRTHDSHLFMDGLRAALLPKFIQQETDLFMSDIDGMKRKLDGYLAGKGGDDDC